MRKRNIQVITRLNKAEHQQLKKLVKKSGLSQEAYLRHLINGVVPMETPPLDYFKMMNELHAIGNNLNQIAAKANRLNVIDVQQYTKNIKDLENSIVTITNAVVLPKKM